MFFLQFLFDPQNDRQQETEHLQTVEFPSYNKIYSQDSQVPMLHMSQ